MNTSLLDGARTPMAWVIAPAAFLGVVLAGAMPRADEVRPVVARGGGGAPVVVRDLGGQFELGNGIVTARINQRNGDLEALIYRGQDAMGHDQGRAGYWE